MEEIITANLQRALKPEVLRGVIIAFRCLILSAPDERHFSIKLCNEGGWVGIEVWCILDRYEGGNKIATFLLPTEY
jgi:hypothetical protein